MLDHPWMKSDRDSCEVALDRNVLLNMTYFAKQNALKRAAMTVIAKSMCSEDMEDLDKQFRRFDTDNSGNCFDLLNFEMY